MSEIKTVKRELLKYLDLIVNSQSRMKKMFISRFLFEYIVEKDCFGIFLEHASLNVTVDNALIFENKYLNFINNERHFLAVMGHSHDKVMSYFERYNDILNLRVSDGVVMA